MNVHIWRTGRWGVLCLLWACAPAALEEESTGSGETSTGTGAVLTLNNTRYRDGGWIQWGEPSKQCGGGEGGKWYWGTKAEGSLPKGSKEGVFYRIAMNYPGVTNPPDPVDVDLGVVAHFYGGGKPDPMRGYTGSYEDPAADPNDGKAQFLKATLLTLGDSNIPLVFGDGLNNESYSVKPNFHPAAEGIDTGEWRLFLHSLDPHRIVPFVIKAGLTGPYEECPEHPHSAVKGE